MKLGGLLLIGRFKKKKRGRKKKGEFSFWETNLGLEGLSYKRGEQKNERRGDFSLRKLEVRIGGEGGDSGKRWRSAQEQKREIAAKVLPGTLPVIFYYYFGISVYIHLRFSGCFREVVLADWSGH